MLRRLKDAIKRLLALFGLVIFKRSTGIYIAEEEIPGIAVKLCGSNNPLVIDGGAHTGAFVDAIRESCPGARFLCFEPDPTLASMLRGRFKGDTEIQVVQAALGMECGNAVFNINRGRATNSLASVSSLTGGVLSDLTTTVERIDVIVTTLDEELRQRGSAPCDIVKLDLQGYDLPALKGAAVALRSAKVVIVEVWFAPVYTPTPTFLDTCVFMKERGFEVYTLAGLHFGTDDRLLWSDALFVRDDAKALCNAVTIG
jgi:FkbM family methyltransferase